MDQYLPHITWIDKERAAMVSQLKTWLNIHSGSTNVEGLALMQEELKKAFSVLKQEIEVVPLPERIVFDLHGDMQKASLGKVLRIRCRRESAVQVLFVGHMDIAHPRDKALEKSKRPSRDIITGRGTADMKSGLVIMLAALKSLEMSPFSKKIGWTVLITPDEELGSPGSSPLLLEEAKRHHLALVFEPALADGSLVSARNGSINYLITVRGKSAHAGRDFDKGKNALTSVARLAIGADSLTDRTEGITVNVGYLVGGGALNIVPDQAVCGINIRIKNDSDGIIIKKKIEKLTEVENYREGITVAAHIQTERPPKVFDRRTRALFEALKRCGEKLGIKIVWKRTGGVCDGNTLASTGLPVIDTLGATGGKLHTADEYVSIISMMQRAKLASRFLLQIASEEIVIAPHTGKK